MNVKFLAEITKDGFKVYDEDKYRNHLKKFPEGEQVYVTVKPREFIRSDEANRYYWGVVLKIIAQETGHSTDELHEFFKNKFLQGYIEIAGDKHPTSISTATLVKEAFHEYMEQIKVWAQFNLNIFIPNDLE